MINAKVTQEERNSRVTFLRDNADWQPDKNEQYKKTSLFETRQGH